MHLDEAPVVFDGFTDFRAGGRIRCNRRTDGDTAVFGNLAGNETDPLDDKKTRPLGVRLPLFEHTEKTVVSDKDWQRAKAAMIRKAKNAGDKSHWVENGRKKKTK